ncbi:MAG TPA: dienelactone hydrolase family protein [Gemmatimonadaceae bacterium]
MSRIRFAALASVALAGACSRQAVMNEHAGHDMSAMMGESSAPSSPSLPASASKAAARLASSPRKSEWIKIPFEPGSADTVMAFVVYPAKTAAKAPVVVVIHENTCLITWNRGVADQLAAEGFISITPDLCSKVRGGPASAELPRDSVGKILPGVTPAMRNTEIAAVARWGMALPDAAPRYAVIGFCWGGGTVWMHAINGGIPGYSGGVAFYGTPYAANGVTIADSLAKINKPIMLLSGARDARIGAAMPAIDSMMKALKKDYYGNNYPDAVHGFVRAQDDTMARRDTVTEKGNMVAIRDAWPRTLTFLRKNLGVK